METIGKRCENHRKPAEKQRGNNRRPRPYRLIQLSEQQRLVAAAELREAARSREAGSPVVSLVCSRWFPIAFLVLPIVPSGFLLLSHCFPISSYFFLLFSYCFLIVPYWFSVGFLLFRGVPCCCPVVFYCSIVFPIASGFLLFLFFFVVFVFVVMFLLFVCCWCCRRFINLVIDFKED